MTTIEIQLPDDLAQQAQRAGLLSDSAIQHLLEEAIRRHAGHALLEVAMEIQAVGIPPMSDDELMAEIRAVRAEQRAGSNAGRS